LIEVVNKQSSDCRPYAEVIIEKHKYLGLLDSGAQVSCIGGKLAQSFILNNENIKTFKPLIQTADGKAQVVYGIASYNVMFKDKAETIDFYLVPSLQQEVILGIDFWKKFQIAPQLISQIDILGENSNVDVEIPLTEEEKSKLKTVISLFPCFEKEGLGLTDLMQHKIELIENTKPIKQRYFPVSPAIEKLIHAEIDEMLRLNVIEEAPHSPWSSPIVLIRKNDKVRLCLDSRKVNLFTIKDAYPLPLIDGILSRLPKAQYISSLDLRKAFWQIPLEEKSRDYTCFTVPNRPLYRFKVMPFGLCNAPQALCRLMDLVIKPQLRHQVFVYLDDLLIISECFDSHLKVLTDVAYCLRKAGLTINIEKSKFLIKEVKYLGYIVGNGILRSDPDKISAVKDYPPPKSTKQLRRFLGMAGWYRRFIKDFSVLTVPLTDLLKKGQKFAWNNQAQLAFETLKEKLCTAPVLTSPNYEKPFIIQCDASQLGVGAVLSQANEEGFEIPIAYFSQKLNKAQQNYSTTELECLAAISGLKKFRPYVEGQDFKIVTDHASLKWLLQQANLTGRLARWAMKLQGYKFSVEHRRGSLNTVPDCLSRKDVNSISIVPIVDMESPEFQSDKYQELIEHVKNNQDKLPGLKIVEDKVYKRVINDPNNIESEAFSWKLWLPETLVAKTIQNAHDNHNKMHGGIKKTLELLRKTLYWPKMLSDIKKYVTQCEVCLQTKSPNYELKPPMLKSTPTERCFQRIYIDLLGPYPRSKQGKIGIVIVLDHFSKFVLLKTIRSFTTQPILTFLREEVFNVFGTPECLVSDNGKQFKAKQFDLFLKERGVHHLYTALYSPQANASERVNRSIIQGIRAYIDTDHRNWDRHISDIGEALRSSYHQSIGYTPYFALFGQQMINHGHEYDLVKKLGSFEGELLQKNDKLSLVRTKIKENIEKSFEGMSKRYNLRSRTEKFKVDDIVFRRNFVLSAKNNAFCAKFAPKFVKAKVLKVIGSCMYELEDELTKRRAIYHQKDIIKKKY